MPQSGRGRGSDLSAPHADAEASVGKSGNALQIEAERRTRRTVGKHERDPPTRPPLAEDTAHAAIQVRRLGTRAYASTVRGIRYEQTRIDGWLESEKVRLSEPDAVRHMRTPRVANAGFYRSGISVKTKDGGRTLQGRPTGGGDKIASIDARPAKNVKIPLCPWEMAKRNARSFDREGSRPAHRVDQRLLSLETGDPQDGRREIFPQRCLRRLQPPAPTVEQFPRSVHRKMCAITIDANEHLSGFAGWTRARAPGSTKRIGHREFHLFLDRIGEVQSAVADHGPRGDGLPGMDERGPRQVTNATSEFIEARRSRPTYGNGDFARDPAGRANAHYPSRIRVEACPAGFGSGDDAQLGQLGHQHRLESRSHGGESTAEG
jgi:hypothetical protein